MLPLLLHLKYLPLTLMPFLVPYPNLCILVLLQLTRLDRLMLTPLLIRPSICLLHPYWTEQQPVMPAPVSTHSSCASPVLSINNQITEWNDEMEFVEEREMVTMMDDISMPELNDLNDAFQNPQSEDVPCPNTPALTAAVSRFCDIVNEMNNPNFVVAHRPLPRKDTSDNFIALAPSNGVIRIWSRQLQRRDFCECRPMVASQRLEKLKKIFSDVADLVPYRCEIKAQKLTTSSILYYNKEVKSIVHVNRNGLIVFDSLTMFGDSPANTRKYFYSVVVDANEHRDNVLFTKIKEYQNTHLSLSLQHWYVDLITAVLGSRCHLHSLEHHPDFSIARTWRVEAHMELKRFLRRLQDTELKT
ncbi:hypothetical protein Pmani_029931 [Petrolisthes manimaculis]|uniref:Uncharacterized protein n=1 Tax=Petrolisthes manimaculis TaxID=1843537 RepID=A0AAE1NXU1_9EUCA|nr:hypothetical protein Pmani_029931 [Petrolisthes manimaculis]